MTKTKHLALLISLAWVGFTVQAARADSVSIALTNPVQSSAQGGELSYSGTITADPTNGGPVFLNFDTFTFSGPYALDDSSFVLNFPPSLGPGQSDTDILFKLTLPFGLPSGLYSGTFQLFGGSDGNAGDLLGNVSFSTTSPALVATPEPATWLLLLTAGLILAVLKVERQVPLRQLLIGRAQPRGHCATKSCGSYLPAFYLLKYAVQMKINVFAVAAICIVITARRRLAAESSRYRQAPELDRGGLGNPNSFLSGGSHVLRPRMG